MGTESPTFIQPIAERKDGIQAMFAKQQKAPNSNDTRTQGKRKRSLTPSPPICVSDDDVQLVEPVEAQPKGKAQKLDTWDDDSDIEYVDEPQQHTQRTRAGTSGSKPKVCATDLALSTQSHLRINMVQSSARAKPPSKVRTYPTANILPRCDAHKGP